MAVQSISSNAWNLPTVNNRDAFLDNGDFPPRQGNVAGLPCAGIAWLLRRGSEEAVHSSCVAATTSRPMESDLFSATPFALLAARGVISKDAPTAACI